MEHSDLLVFGRDFTVPWKQSVSLFFFSLPVNSSCAKHKKSFTKAEFIIIFLKPKESIFLQAELKDTNQAEKCLIAQRNDAI